MQRIRDRARCAAQTVEQQQLSLQRRLLTESAQQREARLQELSVHQREGLATESTEEREARLCDDDAVKVEFFARVLVAVARGL